MSPIFANARCQDLLYRWRGAARLEEVVTCRGGLSGDADRSKLSITGNFGVCARGHRGEHPQEPKPGRSRPRHSRYQRLARSSGTISGAFDLTGQVPELAQGPLYGSFNSEKPDGNLGWLACRRTREQNFSVARVR